MVQSRVNRTDAVARVLARVERALVTRTRAVLPHVRQEPAETTAAAAHANALLVQPAPTESVLSKPAALPADVDRLAMTASVLRWRAAPTNSSAAAVAVRLETRASRASVCHLGPCLKLNAIERHAP